MAKNPTSRVNRAVEGGRAAFSAPDKVHKVVNAKSTTPHEPNRVKSRLVIPAGLESSKVVIDGKTTSIQRALAVQPAN